MKKKALTNPIKNLEKLTKGLVYISEIDCEFEVFCAGKINELDGQIVLSKIGADPEQKMEEISLNNFFKHPTTIREGFTKERIQIAKRFLRLKKYIVKTTRNPKVFKVGDVNLEIYIFGKDEKGRLIGVKTYALET